MANRIIDLRPTSSVAEPEDLTGKADKAEMSVTLGSGNDVDKTTIQLKSGTSATVINRHQDISGKANVATTLAGYGITDAKIKDGTITLGSSTITPITQIPTATSDSLGVVKPDNDTITVGQDGVLRAEGGVDPEVLAAKLDAASAAPPFSDQQTYFVGDYVTYGGVLYRCKTAVTTAGDWTGSSNWEETDMTSPDATLDIMSDGRLRVVTAAGESLWTQGYDLESTSAQAPKCEKVNLLAFPATTAEAFDSTAAYAAGDRVVYGGMVYKFTAAHSAGDWIGTDAAVDSVSLTMPYVPAGKVGDFVLDVDNSANASVKMAVELSGLFTAFDVFVDKGNSLSDLLTFDGGEQCELYFTMTAFGTRAKPAWKVAKQVVEKQEAGS